MAAVHIDVWLVAEQSDSPDGPWEIVAADSVATLRYLRAWVVSRPNEDDADTPIIVDAG